MCLYLLTLPVFAENTILIIGDSLSAGYGIGIEQSWPMLLQKQLQNEHYNYRVVNASVSGDTTSNGLSRLPKVLSKYQPEITIIALGANDGLRGLQLPNIKSNLLQIIMLTKKSGSKVLLAGLRLPPNLGSEYTDQFKKMYTDLAAEENIPLVPFLLQNIDDHPDLFQSDSLHPTAKAQKIILNNVWLVLKKMLT